MHACTKYVQWYSDNFIHYYFCLFLVIYQASNTLVVTSKDMTRTKKSLEVALKAHKESVQKARDIGNKIKVSKAGAKLQSLCTWVYYVAP